MYLYVAIFLFAALSAGAGTWRIQDWRYAAKEKERLEHDAEVRKQRERAVDVAAEGHERDKARIRTVFVPIIQEVERVVEKPFYRDLCFDDDGMLQLRAAVGLAEPAGKPAPAVPGPADASRR